MSSMTPAESARLKVGVYEKLYPIALKERLSPAQMEDIANRIVSSGKIFLTAKDELTGYSVEDVFEDIRANKANSHLFTREEEPAAAKSGDFEARFGMSKEAFEKLSSRQKLDLANKEAAKAPRDKGRK